MGTVAGGLGFSGIMTGFSVTALLVQPTRKASVQMIRRTPQTWRMEKGEEGTCKGHL